MKLKSLVEWVSCARKYARKSSKMKDTLWIFHPGKWCLASRWLQDGYQISICWTGSQIWWGNWREGWGAMLSQCSSQNLSQEASVEYSDFEFIIHILTLHFKEVWAFVFSCISLWPRRMGKKMWMTVDLKSRHICYMTSKSEWNRKVIVLTS